jgi:hypothetical protein
MQQNLIHQQLSDAPAAKLPKDEYVQQMRKSNVVGNHPRKGDLPAVAINSEAQGMFDALLDAGSRNAGNPVGIIRQKGVNHGHIQPALISRDFD